MSAKPKEDERLHRSPNCSVPLLVCLLCGILQYVPAFLVVYDLRIPDVAAVVIALVSQYVFWASVGGLIGFSASERRVRGTLSGAVIGLIISTMQL
jgi:hypothetical protein